MDTGTVLISSVVSLLGGGLAGAIYMSIMTPRIQKGVQKTAMRASWRNEAISAFAAWTLKIESLYLKNEATWAGGIRQVTAKATLSSVEYVELLNAADIAIKTNFPDSDYQEFRGFVTWLEQQLSLAYGEKAILMPFEDFHRRIEHIVRLLKHHVWA